MTLRTIIHKQRSGHPLNLSKTLKSPFLNYYEGCWNFENFITLGKTRLKILCIYIMVKDKPNTKTQGLSCSRVMNDGSVLHVFLLLLASYFICYFDCLI